MPSESSDLPRGGQDELRNRIPLVTAGAHMSLSMQSAALRRRWARSIASNNSIALGEICRAGCRPIGMRLVRLMYRSIPVVAADVPAA
jgi:hypothetical protein